MTDPPAVTAAPPPAPPPTGPAPDRPPVPRLTMTAGTKVLGVFGLLVICGYAATAYTDFEPGSPSREELPASVRGSHGGYRSFHFWHSGYHGGK